MQVISMRDVGSDVDSSGWFAKREESTQMDGTWLTVDELEEDLVAGLYAVEFGLVELHVLGEIVVLVAVDVHGRLGGTARHLLHLLDGHPLGAHAAGEGEEGFLKGIEGLLD